ncbi:MAG: hypothetical protein M1821_007986 [Bathelium mastoideum]|nr:MAG: hypothetical protein M1821_007986 [Bathelium mastoideum]
MRLILTAEEKILGPYVALSYCWGQNANFLRLTASNLSRFQVAVPYTDLPTAFKEAFYFVKSLSIRYIWIDALCIIQSGPGATEDWRSQCTRMHDVYSNCILNLSLSRAAHPNVSCLGGHLPEATVPFKVETTGIVDTCYRVKHTCAVVSVEYFREALYDQSLGCRAWALQERLLSPRVLSFGSGELFWSCFQSPHASEFFPHGIKKDTGIFCHDMETIPNKLDGETPHQTYWFSLVEEYTNRELTFPKTDKLVALSAIAVRLGRAMNDVYIAGHFWKTLPLSLNWKVGSPYMGKMQRKRAVPRRIIAPAKLEEGQRQNHTPSWSWASIHGPLDTQYRNPYDPLADLLAYAVTPLVETNPTGQIVSASLTISAYCAEIEWTQEGPNILSEPGLWTNKSYRLIVDIDDPDDKPTSGERYWIAVLAESSWGSLWEGLVLTKLNIGGERLYRRKGHFEFCPSQTWQASWRDTWNPMWRKERRILTLI